LRQRRSYLERNFPGYADELPEPDATVRQLFALVDRCVSVRCTLKSIRGSGRSAQAVRAMRELEVSGKIALYSLPLQCALACLAFFFFRETSSQMGAWQILVSWLVGFVGLLSGLITAAKTRRMRWLSLPIASFFVACASVLFFVGFGL